MIKKIIETIKSASKITIFAHIKTDGDAVGSSLALFQYIKSLGKKVCISIDSVIPEHISFLPNIDLVNKGVFYDGDLAITVDCADEDRLGKLKTRLKKFGTLINIDHHHDNTNFGDINFVKGGYSSTCEVLYDIFTEAKINIDSIMAQDLMVGILTDTGNLFYDSVTPDTFKKAGELLRLSNQKLEYFTRNLFSSIPMTVFELKKRVYQNIRFYENNKIALIPINHKDLIECGVDMADTKSVLEIATNLKDVLISIEISECEENLCYVSFRSKGDIDCSRFAASFGGGGHKNASGCRLYNNLEDTIK
ncbi:MAG: bifunctional oligoribonuclease/PAP phosphatase NrnA, partial [Clostridia bacterium]|nr:bifunctional oligoribonuclease/PAP phosphatase NrnA [Clostridia bacterium]